MTSHSPKMGTDFLLGNTTLRCDASQGIGAPFGLREANVQRRLPPDFLFATQITTPL